MVVAAGQCTLVDSDTDPAPWIPLWTTLTSGKFVQKLQMSHLASASTDMSSRSEDLQVLVLYKQSFTILVGEAHHSVDSGVNFESEYYILQRRRTEPANGGTFLRSA